MRISPSIFAHTPPPPPAPRLYKLTKSCFLYPFCRPNEEKAKILCFAPTSPFYYIFTNGLSVFKFFHEFTDLWTSWPSIVIYLNIIFHPINRKIYLGNSMLQLHLAFEQCTCQSCWKSALGFSLKNCNVNSVFFCYIMLFLTSRINPGFIKKITNFNYFGNY